MTWKRELLSRRILENAMSGANIFVRLFESGVGNLSHDDKDSHRLGE
jgi:hypothetical protein